MPRHVAGRSVIDWFERVTGFEEADYAVTQRRLQVEGDRLVNVATGQRFSMGQLEVVLLSELWQRAAVQPQGQPPVLGRLRGNIRALHLAHEQQGALIQVASQFNLLEMVGASAAAHAASTTDRAKAALRERSRPPAPALAAAPAANGEDAAAATPTSAPARPKAPPQARRSFDADAFAEQMQHAADRGDGETLDALGEQLRDVLGEDLRATLTDMHARLRAGLGQPPHQQPSVAPSQSRRRAAP